MPEMQSVTAMAVAVENAALRQRLRNQRWNEEEKLDSNLQNRKETEKQLQDLRGRISDLETCLDELKQELAQFADPVCLN